ncbi:MAG: hypothetical protein H0V81_13880 [Solirubrobacterales bacterium]|nr:hypothetical protein [Solirubrobacterales bacterium]
MATPFVYEEPVTGDDLIDRVDEIALLTDRALNGRNTRLVGPRRFGKTSVIRAALAACAPVAAATVEVNFLGCVTAEDAAVRIERAYGRALVGPLRRWFDGVVRTLRPTFSAAPGGVGVRVAPTGGANALLDRLALPRRIHEKTGKVCVIAFDEFQEVLRIDPALPGTFRAEMETHGPAAGYIFSGSHPGLMRELFADRRHAFFAQAAPVELGPLPLDALAEVIDFRFRRDGRDAGEALGPLLDAGAGHPQRTMLLAHHLFLATPARGTAGIEEWTLAEAGARQEAQSEIQVLWASASNLERRVLKAVADGTVTLTSGAATTRFGLGKGGSVRTATDRLTDEGHLVAAAYAPAGLTTVDPFLRAWLQRGSDEPD